MSKPPVIIRAQKKIAGIFFVLLLGILGFVLSCFGIFSLFSNRFEYNSQHIIAVDKEPFITITETIIISEYPSQKKTEKLLRKKINRIQILTTDKGPAVCDVFIILRDSEGGCVVLPQDKEETKLVLDWILKFPEFDFENFIKAMGSAENKLFNVWEKK